MNAVRRAPGFTLLEVLVAAVIALALAGLALAIVIHALELWRRVEGNLSCTVQAQVIFDQLERDLHGNLRRGDNGRWLAVELQNEPATLRDRHGWSAAVSPPGCGKPASGLSLDAVPAAGVAAGRFAMGGAWLRLFSLDSLGLPVAVSYQLVRTSIPSGAGSGQVAATSYVFFRTTSAEMLTRGFDLTSGYDDVLAAPPSADALAENVVDFGVWLYVRDTPAPEGLRRIFPASPADTSRYAASGNSYPDVADCMVRILTDEGTARLAHLESGRGRAQAATDAEWWELVGTHSVVFVRRIQLKGAGQ
jgi:hypothetical protein